MKKIDFQHQRSQKDKNRGLILPDRLSSELAYLCGVLIGDGSIYTRKLKNDYVIKCVGNPKDEKDFYFKIIGPNFKKVFGFLPEMKYHDSKTTFGFAIYSKSLFTYLTAAIGLLHGRKDQRLCLPSIIRNNKELIPRLLRGLFDTDGCISFKRKYKTDPYYPVISLSSKSKKLIEEVAEILKKAEFKVVETYDYKVKDGRIEKGHTIINRIELNGKNNLRKWLLEIGFDNHKHLKKIQKFWKE